MSQTRSPAHVVTGVVRLAFPALFEPKPKMHGGNPDDVAYQATLLLPSDYDLTPLKQAMQYVAREKWGDKMPKFNPDNLPIKAYDPEKTITGMEPGMHMIRTRSKFQPGVVDQRLQKILDPSLVYAGCYVRADINAYAWTFSGKNGISFGLNNIQFVKNGDRIDGRSDASQVFEPVAFDEEDALPVGGGDDGAAGAEDIFGL